MAIQTPTPELDQEYSDPGAKPLDWADARRVLQEAELYWLSSVHSDGQPNVTPLIGIWLDGAWHFSTGEGERKAHNIAKNARVTVTTGCNTLHKGTDVVIEGQAKRVTDTARLQRLADAYVAKYGEEWRFRVSDKGVFLHSENAEALVFEVVPSKILGFGRNPYSQTKWQF